MGVILYTHDEVEKAFERWGCKLLTRYVDTNCRFKWRCLCGRAYTNTLSFRKHAIRHDHIPIMCGTCKRYETVMGVEHPRRMLVHTQRSLNDVSHLNNEIQEMYGIIKNIAVEVERLANDVRMMKNEI